MQTTLKPISLRRLTVWYLAGLLLIAGVSCDFRVMFAQNIRDDNEPSYRLAMSGGQSMLVQRIAALAAQYRMGDVSARAPLLAAAASLAQKQSQLLALNLNHPLPGPGTPLIRHLYLDGAFPLNTGIQIYVAAAGQVAAFPPGAPQAAAPLAYVFAQARAPLLQQLGTILTIRQRQGEWALARLNAVETISFWVILLTLAAEGAFIFQPMIRLIIGHVEEARHLNDQLTEERELLRVTLVSVGDGVITTDLHGNVTWLNPIAEELTGWSAAEAAHIPVQKMFAIYHEDTHEPVVNPVLACLAEQKIIGLAAQTVLRGRHGEERGIEDSAAPIRDAAGNIIGAVLVFRDVTQQRKLAGEMSYRATHDTMTGLLNRDEFELRLAYLLHKAHADETENAVLYIDLDQFKLVNDTCGHVAGDQLLAQIGKLLTSLVRGSDAVARLGGDEFAILLDRCPLAQAQAVAQKICDRLEQFRFSVQDQRFRVGASIGLVPLDSRWADTVTVMHAADACCYAAKEAGRNRVHCWTETDQGIRARHGEAQWATRLEHALDEDRFVLFAQRIQSIGAGQSGLHAEILLRMRDTDGTLLPPGAFLPAAERFHMAPRIDRWVLSKSLDWMRAQDSLETIEMLAVNLSGQSVADAAFQRWALAELADAGPRISRRICLEITETAAVTNLTEASQFIERLKIIGVRVALDDFGAGASSFGYLKSMAADFLKIDGQFVRDLLTDKLDEAAVRCFVEIAGVVGMQTIAEFTESEDIMTELRAMGIDFAQGFHVHRPAPIEELMHSADPQLAAE